MNWTMYRIEFKRILRDPASLFFIVALPAFMFIIFGSTMEWAELRVGNGNIAMSTMIAMSAYGAATATSSVSGMAAVEKTQGWGRQLALTPDEAGLLCRRQDSACHDDCGHPHRHHLPARLLPEVGGNGCCTWLFSVITPSWSSAP